MGGKEEDILKIINMTPKEIARAYDIAGGKQDGIIDAEEAPKFVKAVFEALGAEAAITDNEARVRKGKDPLSSAELKESAVHAGDFYKEIMYHDKAWGVQLIVDAAKEAGLTMSDDAAKVGIKQAYQDIKPHDTPAMDSSLQHTKGRH